MHIFETRAAGERSGGVWSTIYAVLLQQTCGAECILLFLILKWEYKIFNIAHRDQVFLTKTGLSWCFFISDTKLPS